jgi:hypothetical protein
VIDRITLDLVAVVKRPHPPHIRRGIGRQRGEKVDYQRKSKE